MSIYLWDKARLPSAYQEVEYIQSSGTQYINTGYVVNTNTSRIYTKFEPQNVSTSQGSSTYQNPLFGTRTSDYNYETCLWASPSNQTYSVGLSLNGYTQSQATPADSFPKYPLGTIIELDYGKTGGTYNSFTFTWNAQYQGVTPNLLMFGIWSQGSVDARKFFGKLYSFKIYEGDNEVRNFVPCYRKSDSVIGLYDLVNSQFYTNSGTGTFSKGADVLGEKEVKNIYIGGVIECDFTQSDCGFTLKQNSEGSYGRDSRGFYVYNGNTSSSSTLAFTGWKIPSSIYSRGNLKKLELFVKRSGGTQSSCGITVNLDGNRFRYIRTGLQARRPSTTTAVNVTVGGDTSGVEYKYTVDLENAIMSVSFSNDTLTIPSAQISSFYTDWNAGNTNLTLIGDTGRSSAITVSMSKAIFYF